MLPALSQEEPQKLPVKTIVDIPESFGSKRLSERLLFRNGLVINKTTGALKHQTGWGCAVASIAQKLGDL